MSPAQIDQLERAAKAKFYLATMGALLGFVADRRAAGATDEEISSEVEAQRDRLMATFKARLAEIRPLIVRASLGIEGARFVEGGR